MNTEIDLDARWRKSSRSSGGESNCVEVAVRSHVVGIRDTKDREGGYLAVDTDTWTALTTAIAR
jgi:hypothetical protein